LAVAFESTKSEVGERKNLIAKCFRKLEPPGNGRLFRCVPNMFDSSEVKVLYPT